MKTKVPADLATMKAGDLVDTLWKLRQERKTIEEGAELIAKEERRIKDFLIDTMPKSSLERLTGKLANATLKRSVEPAVKDWPAVYKFIVKHDAFDLLQKRSSAPAFRERWEAGVVIPGVEQFHALDISVTKRTS
jgi:hypothetical protein